MFELISFRCDVSDMTNLFQLKVDASSNDDVPSKDEGRRLEFHIIKLQTEEKCALDERKPPLIN